MAELNARIIAKASATAAEEPLAGDLEVAELAVNTADGKLFTKHTDGSIVTISGGGGAVDSVNSQTGVVSLGIQDMDDYEPQSTGIALFSDLQRMGTWSEWMDAHSDPPGYEFPTQQGEWRAYKHTDDAEGAVQIATLDDDGNSSEDWVNVSLTSLLMLITVDGQTYGPIPITAITDIASYGVVITWDINDFDPSQYSWGYELGNPALAPTSPRPIKPMTIQLGYTLGTGGDPLVNGDILQWDNSDQKFKPAQPKERIQDMDDYSIGYSTVVTTISGTWDNPVTVVPSANGEWRRHNGPSYDTLQFYRYDGNGGDYSAELLAPVVGDVLELSSDGGLTYPNSVTLIADAIYSTAGDGASTVNMRISNAEGDTLSGLAASTVKLRTAVISAPVPIADGDILQWVDADQVFKPTQSKERIQDMDDFELVPLLAGTYELSNKVTGTSGNPDVLCWNVHSQGTQIFLSPDETFLKGLLSSGDEITLSVPGLAQPHVATLTTDVVPPGTGDWLQFDLLPAITATEILNAANGTPLTISSSALNPGSQPLAEGDILQWNNTDQKFKPAQSKERIQDMDDYEAEAITPWNYTAHGDSDPFGDGEISFLANSLRLNFVDADDISHTTEINAQTPPYSIWVTAGGNTVEATVSSQSTSASYKNLNFGFDWWPYTNPSEGDPVSVSLSDPNVPIPLSDGDILQWDNADQKFKPAQLPAGGSGAVDSVNGEIGTVSLGIQDMDDFELNPGIKTSGQGYDTFAAYNPTGDGEWFYSFNTRGILQFGANDEDGNPTTEFDSIPANGTMYVSKDNGPWTAYTLHNDGVSGDWVYLDSSYPSTEFDGVSAIRVSATLPADPPGSPLVEGDALRWNATDLKFHPALLSVVDMNDFSYTTTPTESFTLAGPAPVTPQNSGEWFVSASNFIWYDTDPIQTWLLTLPVGSTIEFVTTGGYIHTTTNTSLVLNNSATSDYMTFSTAFPQEIVDAAAANEAITVQEPIAYAPLSEGDILRWDNADQKFKPTNDYILLTTLQAEVAASTDFADFQSRIAAL